MRFNNHSNSADRSGYEEFSRFLRHENPVPQGNKCDAQTTYPSKSLAMVYPVKQQFIKIYDPELSLQNGTMFEELFMPFNRGSCRTGNKGEGC